MKQMYDFYDMIERAYYALGVQAQCQNARDIKSWLEQGLINEKQAKELRAHNNRMERDFFLNKRLP